LRALPGGIAHNPVTGGRVAIPVASGARPQREPNCGSVGRPRRQERKDDRAMSVPPYGQAPDAEPQGRRVSPRLIVAAILIVISLIFIFENTQKVKVRFLIPRISSPLWLALVITFVLGGLVGFFLSRRLGRKKD
jgi:uncharacterized integral membrane protein